MDQPGNTAKNGDKAGSNYSKATKEYHVTLLVYKEQIKQISKSINLMPQLELVSNESKVQNFELEIADVIQNLENLNGNPLGRKFNKRAVVGHLNNARVEINTALFLAKSTSKLTGAKGFAHIVKCREFLNKAKDLIPDTI